MHVLTNVLVTVLVVAAVFAIPRREGAGRHRPCTAPGGTNIMINFTQQLCTQANKTKCADNMMNCLLQNKPPKPANSTIGREQVFNNITACAQQLGYNITKPVPRTGGPGHFGPHSSEENSSEEGFDRCNKHARGLEKFFQKLNLTENQFLPMISCLMTRSGVLGNFTSCINQ
ncbi:hypothetical protein OTU49_000387 [Cherax quadricarinatus]|uniref:Uncharacterized protein n=1 Tax=Cherax quadricarinatus TaxID=27406 RepID=A0AAW0XZA5_CHEQU